MAAAGLGGSDGGLAGAMRDRGGRSAVDGVGGEVEVGKRVGGS